MEKRIDPREPLDRDIYEMTPEELAQTPMVSTLLEEALMALENDHGFLTKGSVFSDDLIRTRIDYKRNNELASLALRPHPYEFFALLRQLDELEGGGTAVKSHAVL